MNMSADYYLTAFFAFLAIICLTAAVTAQGEPPAISNAGAPNAEAIGWKLGCQAYSFNRFTFEEAVQKTASLGLHYIEAYPGQKFSAAHPDKQFHHSMDQALQQEALDLCKKHDIKIVNYGVVGLPGDEKASREVFDFAKAMGIETIVSEPDRRVMPLLDKLTKEYDINVAIHNHPKPSKYWHYDSVLKATKGLNSRIGACVDTGHYMRSELDPLEGVKALEGRIISFHIKDLNKYGRPGEHDVPLGTGEADIKAILTELHRQGVKAVFSFEYEHNWDNSLPEIAQGVAYFDSVAKELAASK